MRRFQRVAVVAAAVAGLSAFGVGAGSAFAHEDDWDGQAVTAVATSTANAVATWGAPHDKAAAAPEAAPAVAPQAAPQAAPEAAPQIAPEAAPKAAAPEYGYGEYSAPYAAQ
ncbi:hypothetical protein [Streptomyces sp. NBC_01092]|uniref:hypothetical protein n=1 Tax=Streptomyces sp. NBC_01092 TaxID=2903748 RepID=UPI003868D3CC|nr:hypothetical protein OG254_22600 [Streptomyces sp. NBC_01092]